MLESLRSQSQSAQPILVVAGVSDVESTRRLVAGLRRQAQQRGISVLAARLTQSREGRILSFLPAAPDEADSAWQGNGAEENQAEPPSVKRIRPLGCQHRSEARRVAPSFQHWFGHGRHRSSRNLELRRHPPSGQGVRWTGAGRGTLGDRPVRAQGSVTRAQASGCKVVGLIVNGHRELVAALAAKTVAGLQNP